MIRQRDLAGCEHEPSRLLLQRRVNAPLKPNKPQAPCDLGLFSDQAAQTDLVIMAAASRQPGTRVLTAHEEAILSIGPNDVALPDDPQKREDAIDALARRGQS